MLASEFGLESDRIEMLIEMFLDEFSSQLQLLQKAVEQQSLTGIDQHSHAIKGCAANLKFDEISSLAKEMEFAAKAQEDSYDYVTSYKMLLLYYNKTKQEMQ